MSSSPYVGRFAPSPTGPLHFGSLVAALGSYLDARAQGGRWLVRMEDLDPPREMPGAADDILHTLDVFALRHDCDVMYQSQRHEAYQAALEQLIEQCVAYPCACTRREIRETGKPGGIYPGTCRSGLPPGHKARSVRLRVGDSTTRFTDRLQGPVHENLGEQVGDFILRRADGLYAYQLAVVIDDAAQGITHVVRGADLLDSTCRQILLQQRLGLPTPDYLHLPVAVKPDGAKLSKQTFAAPLDRHQPTPQLARALRFLGHPVPAAREQQSPASFLQWAVDIWDTNSLLSVRTIEAD
ncbi:Glutamyl-Q tRNA(Asp) synthetase [hydrothermal vent metagenome]|uniref:Glutamyl-Q tRNA(Asp) synthetase n=1 Tax=hydrothermal vent metagenome TaxID=652676 RepID=A0A3B0Z0H4_9ZZZZ